MERMSFEGSWSQSAESALSHDGERFSGLQDKLSFVDGYVESTFNDPQIRTYVTGDGIVTKVAGDIEKAGRYGDRNPNVVPDDIKEMGGDYVAVYILALAEKIEQSLQ